MELNVKKLKKDFDLQKFNFSGSLWSSLELYPGVQMSLHLQMINPCVSVQTCHGPLSAEDQCLLEEQKELHGTNALLMLLPPLNGAGQGEEDEDVTLLSALLQLRQVQQASCWHSPLPLVVVVTGNQDSGISDQGLEEGKFVKENALYYRRGVLKTTIWLFHCLSFTALMLNMLVKDGLISEYIFVHIPATLTDLQGSEQVGLQKTKQKNNWSKYS